MNPRFILGLVSPLLLRSILSHFSAYDYVSIGYISFILISMNIANLIKDINLTRFIKYIGPNALAV
jgi:hypothetical protein